MAISGKKLGKVLSGIKSPLMNKMAKLYVISQESYFWNSSVLLQRRSDVQYIHISIIENSFL